MASEADVYQYLEEVEDPEIPVVSVVDMGIVRGVAFEADTLIVTITPTYSGCPAMDVIERDIAQKLTEKGFGQVRVDTVLAPPWTTDWMSANGRAKLKAYGIAPPQRKACGGNTDPLAWDTVDTPVPCPHCDSGNTQLKSRFGSTACKALHYCHGCHQPFEHFKCI